MPLDVAHEEAARVFDTRGKHAGGLADKRFVPPSVLTNDPTYRGLVDDANKAAASRVAAEEKLKVFRSQNEGKAASTAAMRIEKIMIKEVKDLAEKETAAKDRMVKFRVEWEESQESSNPPESK